MIFKRKRHKLPAYPEYIAPGFKKMCIAIPVESIPAIQMELFEYMGRAEAEHSKDPVVDLALAREIAQISSYLLEHYEELSKEDRGLVIAGVKYFISDGDGVDDFKFASGLVDDAQVINHVLEELDITDRYIDIDRFRN